MSYTNIELIKHHLDVPYPIADKLFDQPVVMEGEDYITFFGGNIEESSVKVKTIKENVPLKAAMTLNSNVSSITSNPIVPGSIIIASDSSMGNIYKENQDFIIDYSNGNLIIKTGGSLSIGFSVVVWYVPYVSYSSGNDYLIKAVSGQIKRISGGSIGDGEKVYIDYTPIFSNVTEDILNNAVVEANGIIEKSIDPYRQFGADPILQAAATYRALEIICRTSAMRELSGGRNNDKAALVWMKLADRYAELCHDMLTAFKESPADPSQPTHS